MLAIDSIKTTLNIRSIIFLKNIYIMLSWSFCCRVVEISQKQFSIYFCFLSVFQWADIIITPCEINARWSFQNTFLIVCYQNVLMNCSDYVLIHMLCRTVKSHRVWTSLYLFSTNWARSSPILAVSLLCRHVKNLSLGCALYMNSLKLLSKLNSKVGAPIHL